MSRLHNLAFEPLASAPRWGLFFLVGDSSTAPLLLMSGSRQRNWMISLLLFSHEKWTRYPRRKEPSFLARQSG